MLGKILDISGERGIVRGEDGKRYEFGISEIKNTPNVDLKALLGGEVDFEISPNGEASAIYLGEKLQSKISSLISSQNKEIKITFFAMIIFLLPLISVPPTEPMFVFFMLIAFVLSLRVVFRINKISCSTKLLKNYIYGILALFLLFITTSYTPHFSVTSLIFPAIMALAFCGFSYLFFAELAFITNKKAFLYALCVSFGVVLIKSCVFLMGDKFDYNHAPVLVAPIILVLYFGIICLIYGFASFKEIRKSYNTK